MISLLFGDVFRYNNKEYIFLAETEEIWYAAEVLNAKLTKQLDDLYQKQIRANRPINDKVLYCYVILKTEEFKNRAAHYGHPGKDNFSPAIDKLPISLCSEDKKQIKNEIESSDAVPLGLKELVKDISI